MTHPTMPAQAVGMLGRAIWHPSTNEDRSMNTAPASLHTINASEACGREHGHNAACANMRAYRVARHYNALSAREPNAPFAGYAPIIRRTDSELSAMVSAIMCRLIDGRPGDAREASPRKATKADTASICTVFHYAARI